MDENMSEDEKNKDEGNIETETETASSSTSTSTSASTSQCMQSSMGSGDGDRSFLARCEESSSSSSNATADQESPSTSSDSGFPFPKSRIPKKRSYRTHHTENSIDSDEDSPADPDIQPEQPDAHGNMFFLTPDADSSNSTIIHDTDDSDLEEDPPVLEKQKPKHNWFVVPSLHQRQMGGFGSNVQADSLFRSRCYGSLRSVQRLELMQKLETHNGCVNSLNFHPDGSLLCSGSDDLKICLWDWKIGKCLLKYESRHKQNVFQSKFLHLGGDLHIASCARDGQVRIAQVSCEEGVRDNRKLGSHRGACHKIAVFADQPHLILSAGEDGCVLSHDLRQNKPEKLLTVRNALDNRDVALYSIHNHPLRSNEFCVCGRDDTVRTFDHRKTSSPLSTYHPFQTELTRKSLQHVTCAVYNYDGSQILASYSDEDIYLFDVNGPPGKYLHRYQGHKNGATIKGVNFFGPRSEFVVSGSDCGHLFFWEKRSEAIVNWMLADDNGVVNCLEPHPWLPFMATSGLDSDIKFWVPSCEEDPNDSGLRELVRRNCRANDCVFEREHTENQILVMLLRHLRDANRLRRIAGEDGPQNVLSSSSSNSSSDSELSLSEDGEDGPSGCSVS